MALTKGDGEVYISIIITFLSQAVNPAIKKKHPAEINIHVASFMMEVSFIYFFSIIWARTPGLMK